MRTIYVYAIPDEPYALCRGHLGEWLRRHGIPGYRSAMHNGWWVRQERLPELMALAEATGLDVDYRTHSAPRHIPPAPVDAPARDAA